MKAVRYTGRSDARTLLRDDFERAGFDYGDVTWTGTEPVDLPDDIADALTSALHDEFALVGSGDDVERAAPEPEPQLPFDGLDAQQNASDE